MPSQDGYELSLTCKVYVYYANDGKSITTNIPLGVPISSVTMDDFFPTGESMILIKLSFPSYSN